ncbi:L-amino acid N-acyltransferase YncA [Actinomycetospora succinea]|uniref:L-amino acid N-acyltransferase YncA n=1 Tax=Actinomycetospora succinea TaxID=663603 RepID=A0A4R6UN88_9PSEU|nr:GNAT family N-acetyltransferase [Actinomycetospora succinea]TDQ46635.1 L-amino acid N-acyltransferase YncA [Actinomycetospora succinea]
MGEVRRAGPDDAATVATLLDDFNTEFDTPTPGVAVLTARLTERLRGDDLVALLHDSPDRPADGLAVVSFRPNVWFDGPVALLDELYVRPDRRGRRIGHAIITAVEALAAGRGGRIVEINVDGEDVDARRFYAAHGYAFIEPGATEPSYYYAKEW